jgi:hypothetical protein
MRAVAHPAARDEIAQLDPRQNVQAANFNGLARLYRWMEYASFGPWLWWCRCAFVDELRDCRCGVVLGDGDGRFTARLLGANPQIEIDAVDASEAMLRGLLQRAGQHADRVHAICADARAWQPEGRTYSLIVTHFFLDCLTTEEARALAVKLRGVADRDVRWVISEFAEPNSWFGRVVARPVVWMLYRAFGLLTGLGVRKLPDYRAGLLAAGFARIRKRAWLGGLLVSELWAGCKDLSHD